MLTKNWNQKRHFLNISYFPYCYKDALLVFNCKKIAYKRNYYQQIVQFCNSMLKINPSIDLKCFKIEYIPLDMWCFFVFFSRL